MAISRSCSNWVIDTVASILDQRIIVERFAVHVHHEGVAFGRDRQAVGILQHAGGVNRNVALRIAEHRENVRCR